MLKLGKLPADADRLKKLPRLASLLPRRLPPVTETFDVDEALGQPLPDLLGANDQAGDCVMVYRANHTLRLECREQGRVIDIPDKDILHQYYKEGGANCRNTRPDNGLVFLRSLECWKRSGWRVGGRRYKIFGFCRIDEPDELRVAMTYLGGAGAGLLLPRSARRQFEEGAPWDITLGFDAQPGSWGGHAVYLKRHEKAAVKAVTWGKQQLITWDFLARYADELYAIVDDRNSKASTLDVEKLASIMKQLEAG